MDKLTHFTVSFILFLVVYSILRLFGRPREISIVWSALLAGVVGLTKEASDLTGLGVFEVADLVANFGGIISAQAWTFFMRYRL
jgi:VanZ family protein